MQQTCFSGEPASIYQVLVNKTHLVTKEYLNSITLEDAEKVSGDTCKVETRTLHAFYALRDGLAEQGIEIGLDSGWRSVEYQERLMARFTEEYGEEYARKTVAPPGTSEHHTGLAIDIVPKVNGAWVVENDEMMALTELFARIHRVLPEYGFVLRYPKGKETVTGYGYECWHLRYVGRETALAVAESGLTLDEYLEK